MKIWKVVLNVIFNQTKLKIPLGIFWAYRYSLASKCGHANDSTDYESRLLRFLLDFLDIQTSLWNVSQIKRKWLFSCSHVFIFLFDKRNKAGRYMEMFCSAWLSDYHRFCYECTFSDATVRENAFHLWCCLLDFPFALIPLTWKVSNRLVKSHWFSLAMSVLTSGNVHIGSRLAPNGPSLFSIIRHEVFTSVWNALIRLKYVLPISEKIFSISFLTNYLALQMFSCAMCMYNID